MIGFDLFELGDKARTNVPKMNPNRWQYAEVAQLVEHATENRRVISSSLILGTKTTQNSSDISLRTFACHA